MKCPGNEMPWPIFTFCHFLLLAVSSAGLFLIKNQNCTNDIEAEGCGVWRGGVPLPSNFFSILPLNAAILVHFEHAFTIQPHCFYVKSSALTLWA